MDVELAEVGDSGQSIRHPELNGFSPVRTNICQKPTPWQSFLKTVSTYKAVCIAVFLALLCTCAGLTVYYLTLRNEWINVHLVAHSHDDVGWLRTPEQYYRSTVKYILNNVIHELQKHPSRKFVYVETYFFWQWWQEQPAETQQVVRELVWRGQLEFAGGAWTMNDEATTNYQSIIDQFTWGLRRLNDTFGDLGRPEVGWQIDTFGHSREMASLLALMGYKGWYFARIDEEERKQRKAKKQMEFIWEDRDGKTRIHTSVMFKHYNPPTGYHYEKVNEGANLDGFLAAIREWANVYQTNNVLVPMGDDFTYYDARAWFENMDQLIRLVKERQDTGINVNLFYSTPAQYLKAIQDTPTDWPVKQNSDMLPYSSDMFRYWTGYYTSRPSLKYLERIANNFLQMTKQLVAMTVVSVDSEQWLTDLREVVGMLLHHDAITGTARQEVNNHYVDLLYRALTMALFPVMEALRFLSVNAGKVPGPEFQPCHELNISQCFISERSHRFVVMAYNSLSWPVTRPIRIPVIIGQYTVINSKGEVVPSQIVPIPVEVKNIPGRTSSAENELVFISGAIPPLGFTSFYIQSLPLPRIPLPVYIPPKNISLDFSRFTGHISSVTVNGRRYPLEQDIRYYHGNSFWSGAYIFRPYEPYTLNIGNNSVSKEIYDGPVVTEVQMKVGPWASQQVRIYKNSALLEIDWLIGPIPIKDYHGKEAVIQYTTNLVNGDQFTTDTNGRGSLIRTKNKRTDWDYKPHEVISGNYYPVTSYISLKDNSSSFYVITDRPQGGSSIRNGQLELMVHRRLCYDDGKGVDEPLNETAYGEGLVVRGRHWLLLGDSNWQMEREARLLPLQLQHEAFLFFAPINVDSHTWSQTYLNEFSGLRTELPDNVRLLTVESWKEDILLIRIEHMFEKHSTYPLSQPTSLQLKKLFRTVDVVRYRETKLGADRWATPDKGWTSSQEPIKLYPADIRTFLVVYSRTRSP